MKRLFALISAITACLVVDVALAASPTHQLTVKGSDTMVHLVTAWAEAYMDKDNEIDISVSGGGSGTGIAALINKTTDICASSRDIKKEEKEQAEKQGVSPTETRVALDGLAIVVHPSNPINELTMEQVKKIYLGEYTNWKDLGGSDTSIVALSRESSSGTYVFFQEHVLGKKDYANTVRLMPATATIVQSVASDKSSVGYVGLGYATQAKAKVKILPIKADDKAEAILPSKETVLSGRYSIARPLFLYTDGLVEVKNAAGDMLEREEMIRWLGEDVALSPQALVERIYARVTQYAGTSELEDDVAALAIRVLDG